MINRILRIIKEEKQKAPKALAVIILWKRFKARFDNARKNLIISYTKDSTFTSAKDLWMCSLFPKKVLDVIIEDIRPSTLLDVGCGTGASLNYFLKHGINAIGLENSAKAISSSPVKEKIIKHNLNRTYKSKFVYDLVWCFEVIEHIHPDYEANFLQTLVGHSDTIIISAARPGQGGHGHFNEQEPQYWIDRFQGLGYWYDSLLTEKLLLTKETHSENILCFKKELL